jgi:hypothetical protein
MRFVLLTILFVLATATQAQDRIFRASQIDLQQDARLDTLESQMLTLTALVEKIASQPMTVATPTNAVRYGDIKSINGVQHRLTQVGDGAKWLPMQTKPIAQPVTVQSSKPTSNRYTTSELRSIIQQMRPGGWSGPVYADVADNTSPHYHLTAIHGFTSDQVSGLSRNEALILHDLRHGGKVSPYRSSQSYVSQPITQKSYVVEPIVQPSPWPTVQASGGCPNGQCPTSPARRVTGFRLFR